MGKTGNPIHLNPKHKGSLTKEVGKKGLTEKALTKEIAVAKKKGDVKLEKKEVFAKNSKHWKHDGKDSREGRLHPVKTDRGEFRHKDNRKGEE